MKSTSQNYQEFNLDIVGGSSFGRYSKISPQQTYNMMISDDFLVNYAGHKKVLKISSDNEGRGIFNSIPFNRIFVSCGDGIYIINTGISKQKIGTIETSTGDVYFSGNNSGQVLISDQESLYVYNYTTGVFLKVPNLDFIPGFIDFQNGRFLAASLGTHEWRLSEPGNGLNWPIENSVGELQTKTDTVMATVRFPGRGNLAFIFGKTVIEPWVDVGNQLFPYQKNSSLNIDYGVLSASTIAASDTFVVWLGSNEKSGPVIMYSDGSDKKSISTDGINYRLSKLHAPEDSYAFLFLQDGHLFYQITFPNPFDNFSLAYDFKEDKFYTLCDENMNFHIAKKLVFFNNKYYFLSFIDGDLYEMDSSYTTYNSNEIPRIRVCSPVRYKDTKPFISNFANFLIEEGQYVDTARVDLSISIDGGVSFGNYCGKQMNALGKRKNRIEWWSLGYSNEIVCQFRFWGFQRFVASNGILGTYR